MLELFLLFLLICVGGWLYNYLGYHQSVYLDPIKSLASEVNNYIQEEIVPRVKSARQKFKR